MDAHEERERAREIILRRLSLRAHSRHELVEALAKKDVDEQISAELLDRFTELDLIDDRAFAEQWVSSRHRHKNLSRRALHEELRRKGVEADVIADATSAIGADEEFDAAMNLAARKLRAMSAVTDVQVRRRRLAAALGRRGYGYETIHRVMAQVLDEDDPVDGGLGQ